MLPVTRRIDIVVVVLVALPLLLACGEAEDLGSRAGSGDVAAVASPSADVATPTFDTATLTSTPGVAELPAFTAEPGMQTPATSVSEGSWQAIEGPQWLTLEEAQALVDFDIVVPDVMPDGLNLIGIGVDTLPDVENGEGEGPLVAYLGFSHDAETDIPDYVVVESLEPPIKWDELVASGMEHESADLLFGETIVARTTYSFACQGIVALTWTDGVVHFAAYPAGPSDPIDHIVVGLVGAIIGVEPPDDVSIATPEPVEPTPTANGDYCDLTPQQAHELAPFPVFVPVETPPPFVLEQIDLVTQRWGSSEGYSPDGTVVIEPTPEMHESIELMMRYTVDGASSETSITISQRSLMSESMRGFFGGPDDEIVVIDGADVRYYTFPDPQYAPDSSTATPETNDQPVTTMYGWVIGETETTAHVTIAPVDSNVVTPDAVQTLITSFIRAAASP